MRITKNKGYVLVTTLVIMSVLLIMTYFLSDILFSETAIARNQKSATTAFYLSEAGVQEAIWRIKNDETTRNTFLNTTDGETTIPVKNLMTDGSYSVVIQNTDLASATITSTGLYNIGLKQAQRKISLHVYQTTTPALFDSDAALFVGGPTPGNIKLTNAKIHGVEGSDPWSMYSGNNINLTNTTASGGGAVSINVSAGSGSTWTVADAGNTNYNGSYAPAGTFNSHPYYTHSSGGTTYSLWSGHTPAPMPTDYIWRLSPDSAKVAGNSRPIDFPYYSNTGNTTDDPLPDNPWNVGTGTPSSPSGVIKDIWANGTITKLNTNLTITGTEQAQYPTAFILPGIDVNSTSPDSYKNQAITQGQYYTSSQFATLVKSQKTFDGIVYVAGSGGISLKNEGTITVNGTLISEGSINIVNTTLNVNHTTGPSGLITLGNLNITNATVTVTGLVYVALTSAAATNANITVTGAILAHDFSGTNIDLYLKLDKSLVNEALQGGGTSGTPIIQFDHWEEEY